MSLIACHECDLLHRVEPLPVGAVARCTRCGAVLYREKGNSLNRTLALSIAGLILFVLANAYPLLMLKLQGQVQQATLMKSAEALHEQGWTALALVVFVTSVLMPLGYLVGMIYVLLPLKFNRTAWQFPVVFRIAQKLQPWGMIEVFMLGILVSIVKLAKMATIVPGLSLYSFAALIFVLAGTMASLDPRIVWDRVGEGS